MYYFCNVRVGWHAARGCHDDAAVSRDHKNGMAGYCQPRRYKCALISKKKSVCFQQLSNQNIFSFSVLLL